MEPIEYLDWSIVPSELLPSYEEIINTHQPVPIPGDMQIVERDVNDAYFVSDELQTWLANNLPVELTGKARFIIMRTSVEVHRDINITGKNSHFLAVNFLFERGSDGVVTTSFYEDDMTLTHRYELEPFKWHNILVSKLHKVDGVTRPRMILRLQGFKAVA